MKLLQVRITEDEYEVLERKIIELSVREGKLLSMPAGVRVILKDYINGNEPEIPSTEESKESIEDVATEQPDEELPKIDIKQTFFDGVDMDF